MPAEGGGAARSFWVAALCLPLFLFVRLLLEPVAAATPRAATAELLGYAASWSGYALAALALCRTMNREALWPRFIATWNWMNLIQYLIMVGITVISLPLLPGWLREIASVGAIGYAMWLQWFAARTALELPALPAASFVFLDLMISIMLSGVVTDLSRT